MVRSDRDERGPPVGRGVDVLGDLDAHDLAPLDRALRQRERPHEAGVGRGRVLQLLLDLGQRAVAGATARGERAGRLAALGAAAALEVGEPLRAVLGDHVGDARREREAGLLELRLVGGAVEQHILIAGVRVVGGVEIQRRERLTVEVRAKADADELDLRALRELRFRELHALADRAG